MRFTAKDQRLFGVALPLGAIRSRLDQAVGEYTDLPELGALCMKAGLNLIQLLPVQDSGFQSSPYSALSAFALHPLYVHIDALPEVRSLAAAASATKTASVADALQRWHRVEAQLAGEQRFPYGKILTAKLEVLRSLYDACKEQSETARAIDAFAASQKWALPYALFKCLKDRYGGLAFQDWPEYRDPQAGDIAALAAMPALHDGLRFYLWIQARCEQQFGQASKKLADCGITLLGDLPILMNEDSADVWANRNNFIMELRAGAPPDMFSSLGQNWGFPIYNWPSMEARGLDFWLRRIKQADRYYSAYRIDHVLGFFRIWALSMHDSSGALGSFVPGARLSEAALLDAGFDQARIQWLSEPHIRSTDLYDAAMDCPDASEQVLHAIELCLDRVGSEELFRFKSTIRGEADIEALHLEPALRSYLLTRFRDRVLLPLSQNVAEGGVRSYVPMWQPDAASAWVSLSGGEQNALRSIFARMNEENIALWKVEGRRLLGALADASDMLVCAEDLGAVPPGVTETLAAVGMLGLRIPRWCRSWNDAGQPYIPLGSYPGLSVCAPSVHDTSTLRGWWNDELDDDGRSDCAKAYLPDWKTVPADLDAKAALDMLTALSACASQLFVCQLQDYLDLSSRLRSHNSVDDRVNVPGTVNEWNWCWRMPCTLSELSSDASWLSALRLVGKAGNRSGLQFG
ncbi:MAG TPA: 4-alpha-glucanotransferase [Spirochaetales bacterium]|nr:4-alpha-glucanotransferase [Spirochaetales bacterium]